MNRILRYIDAGIPSEKDYKRLDDLYTDINRAMLTVYTDFFRDTPLTSTERPPPSLLMLLPR